MTHTHHRGVMTLLLICCSATAGALGQTPGYTGGGYSAPPASASTAARLPLYATRQMEFAIPFSVDPRVAQPIEVHLYVSTDQGRNWKLAARQAPGTRQFPFRAPGDGEYWFASRTVGGAQRSNKQAPLQPELRVAVDTVKPQIEFTARPGSKGEVLASWQLFDQNLSASSLKVEYQEAVGQPWKPVAIQLPHEGVVRTGYQGQTTWWPETHSPTINIRAEVRDRAGNLAVANRRLLLPALVKQTTPNGTNGAYAPSADRFAQVRRPGTGAVPWPSDNRPQPTQPSAGPSGGTSSALAQQNRSFGAAPPALPNPTRNPTSPHDTRVSPFRTPDTQVPARQASTQFPDAPHARSTYPNASPSSAMDASLLDSSRLNRRPSGTDSLPSAANLPGAASTPEIPTGRQSQPPALSSGLSNNAAHGATFPAGSPALSSSEVAKRLPPGEHPQMTNASRFRLEYDVDSVGPSGVAEVQLWATADAGRTWRLWGTDDDLQSPFDVAIDEEGIFGFHVVVVGKNGMAGRRPRTGDLADIWVGIDSTPPTAKLTSAVYGKGTDTGKLLIQWQATDQYLDPRPITLSFSESADGPWTVIVSSLPNTGQFAWPADPQLPSAVFLKLEARDSAGNTAIDQTGEPVQIDGLAPKARIRGIQPIQDLDREAFRVPRRG